MSENTAAIDAAVNAMMDRVAEFVSLAYTPSREWVRDTFRAGLAAYNAYTEDNEVPTDAPQSEMDGVPRVGEFAFSESTSDNENSGVTQDVEGRAGDQWSDHMNG